MKPRSLVLVTVDCLRSDFVGACGSTRGLTPHIDALAARGMTFTRAYAAGTPTYYAFPGILAGREPFRYGRDVAGMAAGEKGLAARFREAGYATGGFVAANPYVSRSYGFDQGFDTFEDFLPAARPDPQEGDRTHSPALLASGLAEMISGGGLRGPLSDKPRLAYALLKGLWDQGTSLAARRPYPSAEVVTDRALRWLGEQGRKPFFLWVHLMDAHHPYVPEGMEGDPSLGGRSPAVRVEWANLVWNRGTSTKSQLDAVKERVISLYAAGVRWCDHHVGKVVTALSESVNADAAVCVTSDHGEHFLEHGERYHRPVCLCEAMVRVPVVLSAPKLPAATRVECPVSMVGLPGTLLDVTVGERGGHHSWWSTAGAPAVDAGRVPVVETAFGVSRPTVGEFGRGLVAAVGPTRKVVLDEEGRLRVFEVGGEVANERDGQHDPSSPELRSLIAALRTRMDGRRGGVWERRAELLGVALRMPTGEPNSPQL